MERTIQLPKISFWADALIDGFVAYLMVKTAVFGTPSSFSGYIPGVEYRWAMGVGASLMLGWTALLIWGAQKPIERKGVLALTVFPVITGIILATYWAYLVGFTPLRGTALICGTLAVGIVLMSYSYLRAGRA